MDDTVYHNLYHVQHQSQVDTARVGIFDIGLSPSSVFSSSSIFTHQVLLDLSVQSCWPRHIHGQRLSVYDFLLLIVFNLPDSESCLA